ncbi:caspase domain-containing protein [Armillaria novae-zelandiae]|uniref:Caspase domain-containing protein n=1 Tax=Armillaria novae-zelandiae TaxID=153914 RepID=A0AA39PL98_9AGAR|nr:caspase domain-containing protein [Armillaria novae-zelandiae]
MLSINSICASKNICNNPGSRGSCVLQYHAEDYFSNLYPFNDSSETARDFYTQDSPTLPKRRALLIGIQYYKENPLDGPLNDVQGLHDVLVRLNHFHPNDITLITDHTSIRPTRANILGAIRNLVRDAQEKDSLLIYYAGHGTRYPGSVYSRSPSMQEDVVEAICPIDRGSIAKGEMVFDITDRDINAIISGISAKITFVLDCCHGGTMVDVENCRSGKIRYTSPLPDMGKVLYESGERLFGGRSSVSHIFLVACKGYQIALEDFAEPSAKIHGAFTHALLQALKSDAERTMTCGQLMARIGPLPSQTPIIYGDEYTCRLWSVGEDEV